MDFVKSILTFATIHQNMNRQVIAGCITDEAQEIVRVKLFDRNQKRIERDVLYIGHVDDIHSGILEGINLILCTGPMGEDKIVLPQNSNIILLVDTSVAEILSDVQDIIYEFQKRSPLNQELLKTILENDSIFAVVNKCYAIFQNPVLVVDSSFRLIAWTKDSRVDDPYWNEIIQDGYPSISTIIALQKANGYKDFIQPRMIESKHGFGVRKIIARIQEGKTILGYLAILEADQEFKKSDMELAMLIAKTMAKVLLYRNVEGNKCDNDRYEQLIIDILDQKIKSERQIQERLPYLKWNPSKRYFLYTIDMAEKDNFDTLSCYFKGTIKKLYPTSNLLIYNKQILVIDGLGDNMFRPEDSYLNALKELLKKGRLQCGISNCFSNIGEVSIYYKQSLLAVELCNAVGKGEPGIHFYSDYSRMYMIQVCSKHESLSYFYHPAIIQLKEYDLKKNTHYIETLEAFLMNNKNSYAAADAIFIHRNTMIYRINKIKEITGLSFDDKEIIDLMMSLEILKYERLQL